MEIIKTRKVLIVTVKLILTSTFIFVHSLCSAQIVEGKFYGDDGIIYNFKDSTFNTITRLHMGKEIAKGFYNVIEDTLIFNYRPSSNPTPSNFEFIKKKNKPIHLGASSTSQNTTGISVEFKIVNHQDKPLKNAVLLLANKDGNNVMGFAADSAGKYPKLSTYNKFIEEFKFTFIGYEPLRIKADTLAGYNSKIKVILSPSVTYSQYNGIKKYLIKEAVRNRIVLQRIEDKGEIVLVRKDTEN